jgi:hypothetical protein
MPWVSETMIDARTNVIANNPPADIHSRLTVSRFDGNFLGRPKW